HPVERLRVGEALLYGRPRPLPRSLVVSGRRVGDRPPPLCLRRGPFPRRGRDGRRGEGGAGPVGRTTRSPSDLGPARPDRSVLPGPGLVLEPVAPPVACTLLAMPFADLRGARLFFTDEGTRRPLAFVHGFSCDSHDWSWQLPHFQASHRLIAIDLRGHGRSSAPDHGYEVASLAADVAALLD